MRGFGIKILWHRRFGWHLFLSSFFLGSFSFLGITSGGRSSSTCGGSGSTFSGSSGSSSSISFFKELLSTGNLNDRNRRMLWIHEIKSVHLHVADFDGMVKIQRAHIHIDVVRHILG